QSTGRPPCILKHEERNTPSCCADTRCPNIWRTFTGYDLPRALSRNLPASAPDRRFVSSIKSRSIRRRDWTPGQRLRSASQRRAPKNTPTPVTPPGGVRVTPHRQRRVTREVRHESRPRSTCSLLAAATTAPPCRPGAAQAPPPRRLLALRRALPTQHAHPARV